MGSFIILKRYILGGQNKFFSNQGRYPVRAAVALKMVVLTKKKKKIYIAVAGGAVVVLAIILGATLGTRGGSDDAPASGTVAQSVGM